MKKPVLFVIMLIAVLLQVASLIVSLYIFDPNFFSLPHFNSLTILLNGLIISFLILYTLVLCLSQIDFIPKIHYGEDVMPSYWTFTTAVFFHLPVGIFFLFLVPTFDLSVIMFFILFFSSGIVALFGCIQDIMYRRRMAKEKYRNRTVRKLT